MTDRLIRIKEYEQAADDKVSIGGIARLAQPEPEPVAWFMEGAFEDGTPSFTQVCETDPEFYVPLYTAPPQRGFIGLTDEEIQQIEMSASSKLSAIYLAEAQLKGKNAL